MTSRWTRLGPAAGLLFVAAYILVLAVSGDNPDDSSSSHSIATWYGSHSNRVRELIVFFIAVVGSLAFLWFLAHLRTLIREAAGDHGGTAALAVASGTAFATLFALMGAFFAVPAFVIIDAGHRFALDPNTFRLLNALGDLTFVAAFALVAPLAFTVGAVAWRTRMLPRWLAVSSHVAGVGALACAVWFPSFLVVLWVLVLSGYLAFRPFGARSRVEPATATA